MFTRLLEQLKTLTFHTILPLLATVGLRLLAAVAMWLAGRWVIRRLRELLAGGLTLRGVDPTVQRYAVSAAETALSGGLFLGIIGFLGFETASVAALLAGAGLAIGTAWGELLKNFAAGIFLVFLRPFAIGDLVTAAGITGTVQEIGIFVTSLNTPENARVFIGNNKLFSDNITNHSANRCKRIDLALTLPIDGDLDATLATLVAAVARVEGVLAKPAPSASVTGLSAAAVSVVVRPHCEARDTETVAAGCWKALRVALRAAPGS